jgi:hypothetical protein
MMSKKNEEEQEKERKIETMKLKQDRAYDLPTTS